jgi:hypothetical protein
VPKENAMKVSEEADVRLHAFLTSAPYGASAVIIITVVVSSSAVVKHLNK